MSGVRAFVERDVPQVAALRQRSFRNTSHPGLESSEAYFRRIFFEGPFRDRDLPGLVYEDAGGRIVGFVGRLTRRMTLAGEPLRMAVTTQLCVDAAVPGTIAVQLLTHAIRGPQDLIWTDSATDRVRLLWSRLGGDVAQLQSLHWTLDIRPSLSALAGIAGGKTARAFRLASRFLLRNADRTVLRRADEASSHLVAEIGDAAGVAPEFRALAGDNITSADTPQTAAWLEQRVQEKFPGSRMRSVVLRNDTGAVVGAYSYVPHRGASAYVVQIAALAGQHPFVVAHLVSDAGRQGAVQLAGRLEPVIVDALAGATVRMAPGAPWSLFHTRRAALRDAITAGRTRFSRLDGEWWLDF